MQIRAVKTEDKDFWYTLDRHLPEKEFDRKIRDKMGYVICEGETPVGILRYHLFWDNTPFLAMLFVDWQYQKKGYGRALMEFWEEEMRQQGYGMLLVSTQVDENAQHFYRKLGYKDCGGLLVDVPGYEQPMEMFMVKGLKDSQYDGLN